MITNTINNDILLGLFTAFIFIGLLFGLEAAVIYACTMLAGASIAYAYSSYKLFRRLKRLK